MCWLDDKIGVHKWKKLINRNFYRNVTIYDNQGKKKENTKYLNPWKPNEVNVKRIGSDIVLDNLVYM